MPGNFVESQILVDNWASQKIDDTGNWELAHTKGFKLLVQWVQTRQELGLPKLCLKLTSSPGNLLDAEEISLLCKEL